QSTIDIYPRPLCGSVELNRARPHSRKCRPGRKQEKAAAVFSRDFACLCLDLRRLPTGYTAISTCLGPTDKYAGIGVAPNDLTSAEPVWLQLNRHIMLFFCQPLGNVMRKAVLHFYFSIFKPLPSRRIQCSLRGESEINSIHDNL